MRCSARAKELSVGPSTTPAITAASIVAAASVASNQGPVLLAGLAVVSGAVMIASGFLRLGFIADFFSRPVLVGFVTGIAIDVIVGQLPKLLGVPAGSGNTFAEGLDAPATTSRTRSGRRSSWAWSDLPSWSCSSASPRSCPQR